MFFVFQIPGASIEGDSDYETHFSFKLEETPEVINILDKSFVIAGVIAFIPSITDGDIGHYICISKINKQWEIRKVQGPNHQKRKW